jgi:hypothetical protein
MKGIVTIIVAIGLSLPAFSQASKPGVFYVKVSSLEERLAPSGTAPVTNRIYLRQKVEVLEVKGEWARVSKYYEGSVEGRSGQVARWVLASGLSSAQPKVPEQPETINDPRIGKDAIPKIGEGGLTAADVQILRRGSLKFLDSRMCKRIEYADKSTTKPNAYYVNCGGPNIFFTPADL